MLFRFRHRIELIWFIFSIFVAKSGRIRAESENPSKTSSVAPFLVTPVPEEGDRNSFQGIFFASEESQGWSNAYFFVVHGMLVHGM